MMRQDKSEGRMSIYRGMRSSLKVGVYQGSVLSLLLLAIVVYVIREKTRRSVINELLYADDLVLMSETMEGCIGE